MTPAEGTAVFIVGVWSVSLLVLFHDWRRIWRGHQRSETCQRRVEASNCRRVDGVYDVEKDGGWL